MTDLSIICRRDSYDDYDHSNDELYVYDQCCENCIYYCDWDEDEENGCKNYNRPDYEKTPAGNWCCDWKGKHR